MKRMIRCQYIPDITERYPEGFRDTMTEEEYDLMNNPVTLSDAVSQYCKEAAEGDYYNRVRVIKDGKVILETYDLTEVCAEPQTRKYRNWPVERYHWHDADIVFVL